MKKQGVGPASYFPSIVATYGRSIAEWKRLMRASGFVTYKDLVAWLKQEHGFGHGHANAITIHPAQVDAELFGWLRHAWEASLQA